MRYPASEKLEIIRLVERSHLPVRRTLDKLGIPATTFYRWYDRYRAFGEAGLEDRTSGPGRIWNREYPESCALGHSDEKERSILWQSRRNYWTSCWRGVIRKRYSPRTVCLTS